MRRTLSLLAAALLFFAGSAHALTLAEIRTRIRTNIHDTSTSSGLQRYSDATLTQEVNEAQRDVVNQTWCLETSTSITVAVGTTYYNLPTDVLTITQVRFRDTTGLVTEMSEVGRRKLFQDDPNFENNGQSSPPSQYFIQFSTAGGANLQMGVYSAPSSTGTLLIDYIQQAADLSADSDIPLDGYRALYVYHYALVYRVSSRIRLREGFSDADAYSQLYAAEIASMLNRVGAKPNSNPGFKGGKP
jgi:hypothetical protein